MRYFYSKAGKPEGPVDADTLDKLAEEGIIVPKTPVIEEGSSTWSTYAALRPSSPAPAPTPAPAPAPASAPTPADSENAPKPAAASSIESPSRRGGLASFFGFIAGLNERVDALLNKLFRLPSWVPDGEEARCGLLGKISGITGALIWLCIVLSGIAVACKLTMWLFVPVLLGSILYGFILQYLIYQISRNMNAMILGQRIVMSSVHFPRFLGAICSIFGLVTLLVCLFYLFTGKLSDFFLSLASLLILVCMSYLNFNADKVLVTVKPAAVSPGREFNNYFRLLIRSYAASLQVFAPLLIVAGALSLIFFVMLDAQNITLFSFGKSGGVSVFKALDNLLQAFIYIHIPLIAWIILGLGSWIADLLDAIFSLPDRSSRD